MDTISGRSETGRRTMLSGVVHSSLFDFLRLPCKVFFPGHFGCIKASQRGTRSARFRSSPKLSVPPVLVYSEGTRRPCTVQLLVTSFPAPSPLGPSSVDQTT